MCETIGASVLWDNGAFSAYTKGLKLDDECLYRWLDQRLYHPHRAVVRDVIDGDVFLQREAVAKWPFPRDLSWPVWHLDKPLDYLSELCDGGWSGICLGSAGQYWQVGSYSWSKRMEETFNHLWNRGRLPWLHGLRMLGQVSAWPIASADSTNVAQNYGRDTGCAYCKTRNVKRSQHGRPSQKPMQLDLLSSLNPSVNPLLHL